MRKFGGVTPKYQCPCGAIVSSVRVDCEFWACVVSGCSRGVSWQSDVRSHWKPMSVACLSQYPNPSPLFG